MRLSFCALLFVIICFSACGRSSSGKGSATHEQILSSDERQLLLEKEIPLLPDDESFEVEDLKSVDYENGKRDIEVTITTDSKEYVELHTLIQAPSEHFDLLSFFDPAPVKDLHTFQIRQFAIYPEKQFRAEVNGESVSFITFSARVFYKHQSSKWSNWANLFFLRPSGTTAIYGIVGVKASGKCLLENSVKCAKDEYYVYWSTLGDLSGYKTLRDVLMKSIPSLATKYSAEIRKRIRN